MTDFNDRKRIDIEEVKKAKMSTIGELTAIVAHELRNPLGTIRNSLYTIQQRIDEQLIVDDVIDNAVGRITRNIERCDNIVRELMEYTRVSKPLLRRTSLHRLVDEVIQDIEQHEKIKIYNNIDQLLYLNIDEEKIRRVFINLINNSREAIMDDDFGPGYGNIKISNHKIDDGILITVFDNGPGIPENDIKKLMEPLISTKGFGIGLGLPIVQKIIEEHHGTVEIQSKIMSHTKINIFLPKYRIV